MKLLSFPRFCLGRKSIKELSIYVRMYAMHFKLKRKEEKRKTMYVVRKRLAPIFQTSAVAKRYNFQSDT